MSLPKKLNWLPIEYRKAFKTTTLVYKFLHSGIPQYFDTSSYTNVVTTLDTANMRESTLQYQDFCHLFTNQQSISLPVLPLMLQHCEINFTMRCALPPQQGFSGESLRLISLTRHIHHNSYIF